jgi:ribosomal-protein-alanine N-acetyltransferase
MTRLDTTRLWLFPFTLNDLDFLHALWLEPEVRRYLWDDEIITRKQTHEVIVSSLASFEEFGFGFWKLVVKASESSVGFCGLRHFEDHEGGAKKIEILYGLSAPQWGQGFAVEAAQAVLQFAFAVQGLDCIYAGADPSNKASFRVMERLGLHFDYQTILNGLLVIYYVASRNAKLTGHSQPDRPQAPMEL